MSIVYLKFVFFKVFGSGAHSLSQLMGTGVQCPFLGIKQLEHEIDHSHPSSAKVKNELSYTSVPQ
jgi:hypothetical protein